MNNKKWPKSHPMSEIPGNKNGLCPGRLVLIEYHNRNIPNSKFCRHAIGFYLHGAWWWDNGRIIEDRFDLICWRELPKPQVKPQARAIMINGKWEKIEACFQCIGCLVNRGGYSSCGYDSEEIKDCHSVLKTCRLPFYDDVRDHSPDETPKELESIIISYMVNRKKIEGCGCYDGQGGYPWRIYNYGRIRVSEIVSWRPIMMRRVP